MTCAFSVCVTDLLLAQDGVIREVVAIQVITLYAIQQSEIKRFSVA